MKEITFIFIFLCAGFSLHAINPIADDDELFTPEQLRNDAIYFFQKIDYLHPYLYHSSNVIEFSKQKHWIFSQLDRPMTKKDFQYVLSSINSCMDSHSRVFLDIVLESFMKNAEKNNDPIFSGNSYEEGKIFYPVNGQKKSLISINGIHTEIITSFINKRIMVMPAPLHKFIFEDILPVFLYDYFNVRAPFLITWQENGEVVEEIVEGTPFGDKGKNATEENKEYITYKLFPNSSIGLLTIKAFSGDFFSEYSYRLKEFADSLKVYHIKNTFINLNNNPGGTVENVRHILEYFGRDSLYLTMTKAHRSKGKVIYEPDQKEYHTFLVDKEKKFVTDNIFVLQNNRSASAADLFPRIFSYNGLGILIGQPTGSFTADCTLVYDEYALINTKIEYYISSEYWDFSAIWDTTTLEPDVFWDTYDKVMYTEDELIEILEYIFTNYPHLVQKNN